MGDPILWRKVTLLGEYVGRVCVCGWIQTTPNPVSGRFPHCVCDQKLFKILYFARHTVQDTSALPLVLAWRNWQSPKKQGVLYRWSRHKRQYWPIPRPTPCVMIDMVGLAKRFDPTLPARGQGVDKHRPTVPTNP